MGRFPVSEQKERELRESMTEIGLRESDLEEQFIRSPGPGGQKVNKSSTAVRLRHVPSGVEVRSSSSRSQGLNRFHARRLLVERYRKEILRLETARDARGAKKRKQKDRRARRARSETRAKK